MFGILIRQHLGEGATQAQRIAKMEAADGTIWVAWPDGTVSQPAKPMRRARRVHRAEGAAISDGQIAAPCAGSVTKRDFENGATAKAGERLGVLEAMKMEFALIAPHAGRVRWRPEGDGRVVQKGVTLVIVESGC